jgi:hypothetical protein
MHILLGILIFKGLTARRHYKSFGVKGLREDYDISRGCISDFIVLKIMKGLCVCVCVCWF